jgi:hypothetical protein
VASTWPEQEACEQWWIEHRGDLKVAVTTERINQQERAEENEALLMKLKARCNALEKVRQIAIDLKSYYESGMIPPAGMLQDFSDAITATGERPGPYLEAGEGGEASD